MNFRDNEELLSHLFEKKANRNSLLTDEYRELSSVLKDFKNHTILINVPLSQLCKESVIKDCDKPLIFSIILPLVVCYKVPIAEFPAATEYYPTAIILDSSSFFIERELDMIKQYSQLIDVRFYKNNSIASFVDDLSLFLRRSFHAISNRSESLSAYVSGTSLCNEFVLSHETAISALIQPKAFLDSMTKNMWTNGSNDLLVISKKNGEGVLAIEYDGPHHSEERKLTKDEAKDKLLFEAGIPTLRIKSKNLYIGSNYKFTGRSLPIRILMVLIDMLTKNIVAQREMISSMRRDLKRFIDKGGKVGFDEFEMAHQNAHMSRSDFLGYEEKLLGGYNADYAELYFNQKKDLPSIEVNVKKDKNVYMTSAKMNGTAIDFDMQCNHGNLEFWSKYFGQSDLFESIIKQAVKTVFIDLDFTYKKMSFENHGTTFNSPLQARLSLEFPEERERHNMLKREDNARRSKEVLTLLNDAPSKNDD